MLIAIIFFSGCLAEKMEIPATKNIVYNCQCHEEPWRVKAHYETSCYNCHGDEVVEIHKKILGERDYSDCYKCHERSLLSNHMPKGCEVCHNTEVLGHNIETIHRKFEVRWISEQR